MTKKEFQAALKVAERDGYNRGVRAASKLLCQIGLPVQASMVQELIKPAKARKARS